MRQVQGYEVWSRRWWPLWPSVSETRSLAYWTLWTRFETPRTFSGCFRCFPDVGIPCLFVLVYPLVEMIWSETSSTGLLSPRCPPSYLPFLYPYQYSLIWPVAWPILCPLTCLSKKVQPPWIVRKDLGHPTWLLIYCHWHDLLLLAQILISSHRCLYLHLLSIHIWNNLLIFLLCCT